MAESPLRPVDDQARRQAKAIVRTATFGALATIEPETGAPLASRVGVASDTDGAPVLLISSLAAHFVALSANPACSLLLGEPGKGDPLAHPRLTMIGKALRIEDPEHAETTKRLYLRRHPKAELYVGFADFAFWRIDLDRALFNAGFGKAYSMAPEDLLVSKSLGAGSQPPTEV
ncbi:MAG: pyridoxamine 5'-phosphate oxidase family protein [Pseudomonadota bacterium]